VEDLVRQRLEELARTRKPWLAGFAWRSLAAALVGLSWVLLLNLLTPLEFMTQRRALFFGQGGWAHAFSFALFGLGVVVLVMLAQHAVMLPLIRLGIRLRLGGTVGDEELIRARRRLLNLPLALSGLSLAFWLLLPPTVVLFWHQISADIQAVPNSVFLFFSFRAFMVGLISSTVAFFWNEEYARKRLIPAFFPDGRLSETAEAIRVSIGLRIYLLYLASTLIPMIILLVTLGLVQKDLAASQISAQELGRETLLFGLALALVAIASAFRLNRLVRHSITKPLGDLVEAVGRVKEGDFQPLVEVVSNDEIGLLGEATNEMIQGLAERERIREIFGRYVTPEIRDEILAGRIPLNGEVTEATLLFSDLRGFTGFVEKHPPEEVMTSMRAYFTVMQQAIRDHKGLVLQFVGDEIESVFGVPLRCEDHADRAVMAALKMRRHLEEFNRERQAQGKPSFKHGLGIHTGRVLAGNSGSLHQPYYALIGDTVNLASRIQDLTKEFNWDILISQEAVERLTRSWPLSREEPRILRGFSSPISVYRLL